MPSETPRTCTLVGERIGAFAHGRPVLVRAPQTLPAGKEVAFIEKARVEAAHAAERDRMLDHLEDLVVVAETFAGSAAHTTIGSAKLLLRKHGRLSGEEG